MTETLPWVLFSLTLAGGGVLWLRRNRRVGRGKHSESDREKSVAVFAEVTRTVYAPRDAASKARLNALRVTVPAKLSALLAQYPHTVTSTVDEDTGRHGRHTLIDHRPSATAGTGHRPGEGGVMVWLLGKGLRWLWVHLADGIHFGLRWVGVERCVWLRLAPRTDEDRLVWAERHVLSTPTDAPFGELWRHREERLRRLHEDRATAWSQAQTALLNVHPAIIPGSSAQRRFLVWLAEGKITRRTWRHAYRVHARDVGADYIRAVSGFVRAGGDVDLLADMFEPILRERGGRTDDDHG